MKWKVCEVWSNGPPTGCKWPLQMLFDVVYALLYFVLLFENNLQKCQIMHLGPK
jgi:hypothetical protein